MFPTAVFGPWSNRAISCHDKLPASMYKGEKLSPILGVPPSLFPLSCLPPSSMKFALFSFFLWNLEHNASPKWNTFLRPERSRGRVSTTTPSSVNETETKILCPAVAVVLILGSFHPRLGGKRISRAAIEARRGRTRETADCGLCYIAR